MNKIICEDCLRILPDIESESVHLVITLSSYDLYNKKCRKRTMDYISP